MQNSKLAEIIKKCQENEEFKKRFMEEPRELMQEMGIKVPEGKEIKVLENTDDLIHVVLPAQFQGELCDDDLDGVAGGRLDRLDLSRKNLCF